MCGSVAILCKKKQQNAPRSKLKVRKTCDTCDTNDTCEKMSYISLGVQLFSCLVLRYFVKKKDIAQKCGCNIFRYLEKNMRYLRFGICRGFGISWQVEGITRKSIGSLHFRETRRAGRKSQKEEIYSSKHTRVQTGTDKADIKQKYKSR